MAGSSQHKDEGIVRCACNNKEDYENYIACDRCFVWQHFVCMGVDQRKVPKHYYCDICSPSSHFYIYEKGSSKRHYELKIEEFERIKALDSRKSRSIVLTLPTNKTNSKIPRKYNQSSSKSSSFSRQVIASDSDDSSCSPSPTLNFTTKRGRKTNRISYENYSTKSYREEPETRDSSVLSSKGASPNSLRKTSSDLSSTSDDEYCSFESQDFSSSSPVGSPIQPLPPMQSWLTFSSTVPLSTEDLGFISPIPSPVLPPADFSLSPLFAEEQLSPLRPRNVHGRMSIREGIKRVEAMKKYVLDFQASLEEEPERRGAFRDSSESAAKLLNDIKQFTRRFGN